MAMVEADRSRPTGRRYEVPAVKQSRMIDSMIVGEGCLAEAGTIFAGHFDRAPCLIVADDTTYAVAGERVRAIIAAELGKDPQIHVMPSRPRLAPDRTRGDEIAKAIAELGTREGRLPVAVAVGSGVVNDLTRYAAFHAGTVFMSVPTAASMDGYTSAGAPLADRGFKITIQCAPPRVILADLDIIASAPAAMSGWGLGDLSGKMPAGGDWLVADALGIEPLDPVTWSLVQDNLRSWLSNPAGVRRGEREAIADLFIGLAVSGVAMELHGSSRPASGADHQIAHIWEMEGLAHEGEKVSHGACVAIGALTMLSLYDWLVAQDIAQLDLKGAVRRAPDWRQTEQAIGSAFDNENIAARAIDEMRNKWTAPDRLEERLHALRDRWPALRDRLAGHLMRESEMRAILAAAGAPVTVGAIGLTPERHRATVLKARWIRKRYTLLDMLADAGLLERAVTECFHAGHPIYA